MKFLAFIVLLMIVLAQFIKADTQMSEPEVLEFKPNNEYHPSFIMFRNSYLKRTR